MRIIKSKKPIKQLGAQFAEIYDKGFEDGQESKYRELASKYLILSYEDVLNIKKDAVMEFLRDMCIILSKDAMYSQAQIFEVADKLIRGSR